MTVIYPNITKTITSLKPNEQFSNKKVDWVANKKIYDLLYEKIDWEYCYKKDKLYKIINPTLYLSERMKQKCQVTLKKNLGSGGSKIAYELIERPDQALLLPNLDVDLASARVWPDTVKNEIKISELHTQFGLLSLKPVEVGISVEEEKKKIPAYLSTSFESLKEQGLRVIDTKNPNLLPSENKQSLFKNNEDIFNEEKWEPIFEPLLKDIAKIVHFKIPNDADSLNFAIQKVTDEHQYEVRYLGFDFPPMSRFKGNEKYESTEQSVKRIFSRFSTELCFFEASSHDPKGVYVLPSEYQVLNSWLKFKYIPKIIQLIDSLNSDSKIGV